MLKTNSKMIKTIHPFPARMAAELALSEIPDNRSPLHILDPMSGSGTTLALARLRGHNAIGFDRDPLAVLVARTWISDVDEVGTQKEAIEVLKWAEAAAKQRTTDFEYPRHADEETRKFMDYWFDADNKKQLTVLAEAISLVQNKTIQDVLWCAVSRLIITKSTGVSLAMDVSHSRPHKTYDIAPKRLFQNFLQSVDYIIKYAPFTNENKFQNKAIVKEADARKLPLEDQSIDIIITSPPYLNAIDYLRGHKLSLVWMGYNIASLRTIRSTNIGTENAKKNSLINATDIEIIKMICSGESLDNRRNGMLLQYIKDLRATLTECFRVLKKNGKSVFVIGNCNSRNTFISNSLAIEIIGQEIGFLVETIRSRPLPENRRYLPPPGIKTAGDALQKRMREEVILTFNKHSK